MLTTHNVPYALQHIRNILPNDIPWISAIGCTPHFFYDPDGFVEKAGAGAVQTFPPARDAHVLIIPNSE